MKNHVIEITTREGFGNNHTKQMLQVDILSTNLLVLGDPGSGRIVGIKSTIDHLLDNGRNILLVDLQGEYRTYVHAAGGHCIPSSDFDFGSFVPGLTNITFSKDKGKSDVAEFLSKLLVEDVPLAGYQYIVIDGIEALFAIKGTYFSEWISRANANDVRLIATSGNVSIVLDHMALQLVQYFPNVLNFRSRVLTNAVERDSLRSGEALLSRVGEATQLKLRFVPTAEEFQKYAI
jgi:hypothetical protein